MFYRRHTAIMAFFGMISLGTSGCTDRIVRPATPVDSVSEDLQTGGFKDTLGEWQNSDGPALRRLPYLTPGVGPNFQEIRHRHQAEGGTDGRLLRAFFDLEVDRDPVAQQLKITIHFLRGDGADKGEVRFLISLEQQWGAWVGNAETEGPKDIGRLLARARCQSLTCETLELTVTRKAIDSPSGPRLLALITTTQIHHVTALQGRFARQITNPGLRLLLEHTQKGQISGERTQVMVADGPSLSRVTVRSQRDPKQTLAWFRFENLPTDQGSIPLVGLGLSATPLEASQTKENRRVRGALTGSDYEDGSFIIDITDDQNPTEKVRIVFYGRASPPPSVDQPAGMDGLPAAQEKALFRVLADDRKLPVTLRTSLQLESYRGYPNVAEAIKWWLGTSRPASQCKKTIRPNRQQTLLFLRYAPPLAVDLKRVMESIDVTPETGYILAVESQYALSGKYNGNIVNPKSSAGGPWQLLTGTASDQSKTIRQRTGQQLVIYPIIQEPATKGSKTPQRRLDPHDARTDFASSTLLAGTYLSKLFSYFPHDAGLALLAYHIGQGSVQRLDSRIADFELTLDDVLRFNMVPCERANWTLAVLAMKMIGSDPHRYGF